MFLTDSSCWFIRNVLRWRAGASIAWTVLLLPPITAVFVILSRFSLFHPIQTITECLSLLTSISAIFTFILLGGVVIMFGFLFLEYHTVIPNITCSKVELFGQLLHPRQVSIALAYCLMGIIVGWCCAVSIGPRYEMLGYSCTQSGSYPQMCLNEYHLMFLLAGAFVGFSQSLLLVIHNMNYISFQPVQQYKYLRFKASMPLVVKCSMSQAFYSIRNFLVLYFFLGNIPRTWLCKALNLQSDSSVHPLDSIAGLLDFSLLFHLWISATYLLFMWYLTFQLFRIFVSEVYRFPVQSTFMQEAEQCLPKALTEQQPMLSKFLALQDLALLSQNSPSRRREVFSLSQPGGHPFNWTAISKECLNLLEDLTQRLVAHHENVATNGKAASLSSGSERKTSSETSSIEDVTSPKPAFLTKTPASVFTRTVTPLTPTTTPFTSDLDSPFSSPAIRRLNAPVDQGSPWYGTIQSPHIMRRPPKLWSTSTNSQTNGSPPPSPASSPSPEQETLKPSIVTQIILNKQEQVKNFLAKRVLVMFLFNKLPETSCQALFADSQAHIWALEALSHLVQASFSEDEFGVVQTTLPNILSSLLLLQEAVDRHFRLPHASVKIVRPAASMQDSTYKTLRFALRASVKSAIYRITITFGNHLHAVQMSAEHHKRLQQFLEFKE